MGYAFISYSTKNQASADSMRSILESHGIKTWMAPYDIPIGSRYAQVINLAVKDCSCFVLMLTNDAQNSVWVAKEVERAINHGRTIIPIQLEKVKLNDEFELYISSNQIVAVQKVDETDPMMKRIIDTIAFHCGATVEPQVKDEGAVSTKSTKAKNANAIRKPSEKQNTPPEITVSRQADESGVISKEELDEIAERAGAIIMALESFGIGAKFAKAQRGPTVTRYLLSPATGTRVNSFLKTQDDLSLALATDGVRVIAPVPGTAFVGIEVPNNKAELVTFGELYENEEFKSSKSKTAVCIGRSVTGEAVYDDIASMPHLLVVGATGMGKSVCINSLIASIISRATPDEVKLILIDPKRVELIQYARLPHLYLPLIHDAREAASALERVLQIMNDRYAEIQKLSVRNIDAYNERVKENPALGKPMPKIIIFIDELNDLMITMRDPVENLISCIAQKARAAGIHLVIGTQRSSVNVITGLIKANIPSRIAFKVTSAIESRVALDQYGAEKLLGRGDMLYSKMGAPVKRIQGAYISDSDIRKLVDEIIQLYGEASFNGEALGNSSSFEEFVLDYDKLMLVRDEKFIEVARAVIDSNNASISFIQRQFRIGYSKAAQYIDKMEMIGIVGAKISPSAPRQVLFTIKDLEIFIKEYKE